MKTVLLCSALLALGSPMLVANAPAPDIADTLDAPAQLDPEFNPLSNAEQLSAERARLEAFYNAPVQNQVRIERRVVIRVAPAPSAARSNLSAQLSQAPIRTRFEERKMADCVEVKNIKGVQPGSGNRLVLYMEDKSMVTAQLHKSCRAREFYSGFYVERSEDGKLCVARDKLQSRSGANCELTRMRALVPVESGS